MRNVKFKIDSFSPLLTMVEYGLLLKEAKTKMIDGKLVNYMDLKTPEDITTFLGNVSDWPLDCFEWIKSITKALYYCDIKELEDGDISNILSLIIGLSEIGGFVMEKSRDMTNENTLIKLSDIAF